MTSGVFAVSSPSDCIETWNSLIVYCSPSDLCCNKISDVASVFITFIQCLARLVCNYFSAVTWQIKKSGLI